VTTKRGTVSYCTPVAARVNGPTTTVIGVDEAGLEVRVDGNVLDALLPAGFGRGTRKDGSPNLAHAWARTVDGSQGGTLGGLPSAGQLFA
jgi:hypothetical protein